MIKTWKHKGLKLFYETGRKSGIQAKHADKIHDILQALDAAVSPEQMDFPGLNLHELKGRRKGIYSVTVNGNWRITFSFTGRDATIVNYEDYH